jgi:sarcosine oxidase delta subunit
MAAKKSEQQMAICPVGKFFMDLENAFGKQTDFFKHMTQSRIEFLKAMRSLLDERIDSLEKKKGAKAKKRMTKIKVK